MKRAKSTKASRLALMLQAVDEQLESAETPDVKVHYERLLVAGHSDYEARKLIATILAFYIWHVKRGDTYTYSDYVSELARLPEIDWQDDSESDEHA